MFSKENALLRSLSLFILLALIAQGVKLVPDSGSYGLGSIIRGPLYPLFLKILSWPLAGGLWLALVVQLILGMSSAVFFARTLKNVFSLSNSGSVLIFSLILFPYVVPMYSFGNTIWSEALSYPLFIYAMGFFYCFLKTKEKKSFYLFLSCVVALVLVRRQFIIFYPFLLIFWTYGIFTKRFPFKNIQLLGLMVGSIVLAELISMLYVYGYSGVFAHSPFTWRQLSVAPLYLSQAEDVVLFKDPMLQDLFLEMHSMLVKKGAFYQRDLLNIDPQEMLLWGNFYRQYNHIVHQITPQVIMAKGIVDPFQFEFIYQKLSVPLAISHIKEYAMLLIMNISRTLGFYYGFLIVGVGAFSGIYILRFSESKWAHLLFWSSLLNIGNYVAVALAEPVLRRYTMYTDILQLTSFVIILLQFFRHETASFLKAGR